MTTDESNGICGGAIMGLFQHFMKHPTTAVLAQGVRVTEKEDPRKEGKLTAYCQDVNYLLTMYGTDDLIPDAEVGITNFKHLKHNSAVRHSEALQSKAFCYGRVYERRVLRDFLKYCVCQSNFQ